MNKEQLKADIEIMKQKLASMEEELAKPEKVKHFPSRDETYYYYSPTGNICNNIASVCSIKVNVYKTAVEAEHAYNKAVALEKVKRRIFELQGDWKPDWATHDTKYLIYYDTYSQRFACADYRTTLIHSLPYLKTSDIAKQIISEMAAELMAIFDINN